MSIFLSDALAINDRRTTGDGYLVASARAARTGVQVYGGVEVGRPEMPVVKVYRPAEEVFSHDSLATYANKPITLGHPPSGVSAATWRQHAIGHVDNGIVPDGQFVRVSLMVADAAAIGELNSGTREISAGYTCDLEWSAGTAPDGQTYDAIQRRVRINHVALVPRGRAGADCRIGDSKTGVQDMTTTTRPGAFMDAMPSPRAAQINAILADVASNEVFRVKRAGDAAKELAWALAGTAQGGDPTVYADSARASYSEASDFLHKLHDEAMARVNKLYVAWSGGDTSVNVGGGDLIAAAAHAAYTDRLSDAWRGPADPAPARLTGDATAQDAEAARAKMVADLGKAWEN